jgi:bacillolysin
MRRRRGDVVILSAAFISLCVLLSAAPARGADRSLVSQLQRDAGGKARISYHSKTGLVSFLGTDLTHTIPQKSNLARGASSETVARAFLDDYGELFGIARQADELDLMRSEPASGGRSFVRFQQLYRGIPVFGGELIVQLDSKRNILSANGEIAPGITVDTIPEIGASEAAEKATRAVAAWYSLDPGELIASDPELWIYNPILLGRNRDMNSLVWRMDVSPARFRTIRELVLVDAHLGVIALHFNQVNNAKNRSIYDNNNNPSAGLPGTGPVRTEGAPASGVPDVNNAYDYAGYTYDFYKDYHNRDSLDGAGMELVSTVRYCPSSSSCPYANAFWNGEQMAYGEGYASALDVVGHEMTHGVTEHESHLFYYMQSGAINESFSDIWGELIELTYNPGSSADRWLLGEDLPGGAIRDMRNPPHFNNPDTMTSSYYYCGEGDGGGVHINSGVGNKAAYLITDGDTFNGYTVTGVGIVETAILFYEVQTHLFTSASDYGDLYSALQQAAINLGWSAPDQQQVKNACDATGMNQQPGECPAPEAPICDSGYLNDLFFDNMENTASKNLTSAAITGTNEWYYPQNSNPYGFDATYATSGRYNIWGNDHYGTADYYIGMTRDVDLPAGNSYLHFNHAYAFDDYTNGTTKLFDGGVVEYSTDGGSSWQDAGSLFTDNGYSGTIGNSWNNPLGGRSAFVSESNGYISSRADLSSLAGQKVRVRFRIGTSDTSDPQRSSSAYGWFIDDVRIYVCSVTPPSPTPPPPPPGLHVTLNKERFNGGDLLIIDVSFGEASVDWDGYLVFTGAAGVYSVTGGRLKRGIHQIVRNAMETHQPFAGRVLSMRVPHLPGSYVLHCAILPTGTSPTLTNARGDYSQLSEVNFEIVP